MDLASLLVYWQPSRVSARSAARAPHQRLCLAPGLQLQALPQGSAGRRRGCPAPRHPPGLCAVPVAPRVPLSTAVPSSPCPCRACPWSLPQEQVPAPSFPCRCQLGAGRCLPSPRGWVGPGVAAWTPAPAPGQHLCLLPVIGLAGSTCWLGRWIMRLRSGVGSREVPAPLPPPELLPRQPAGGSARCCDRDAVLRGCL